MKISYRAQNKMDEETSQQSATRFYNNHARATKYDASETYRSPVIRWWLKPRAPAWGGSGAMVMHSFRAIYSWQFLLGSGLGGRPGSWLADPSPTKVQSKHFAGSALPLPPAWARGDLGVNENWITLIHKSGHFQTKTSSFSTKIMASCSNKNGVICKYKWTIFSAQKAILKF